MKNSNFLRLYKTDRRIPYVSCGSLADDWTLDIAPSTRMLLGAKGDKPWQQVRARLLRDQRFTGIVYQVEDAIRLSVM